MNTLIYWSLIALMVIGSALLDVQATFKEITGIVCIYIAGIGMGYLMNKEMIRVEDTS